MKRIFTAVVMLAAVFTASAQIMRLETEQGTKVYDLSKVKSISFSDEANTEDLVKMEVVNASSIAFDLKVTKSASCQKYMAAAFAKSIYKESDFVFSAEQTLDPDAYYHPFAQTLSYNNGVFSESQLGLNALTDESGKNLTFIAAVYAVDDLGDTKIYTREITLPSKLDIASDLELKIETSNIAYNSVDYTISPKGWTRPAKIVYGVTQPEWMKTTMAKFLAMDANAQRNFLVGQGIGLPHAYTNKIQETFSCTSNSDIIIFAMPIDSKGKVGKMAISTLTTPAAEANGIGTFAGLTYKGESKGEDDYYSKATFEVCVDNAIAYRLMWVSESEFNDNYSDNLLEIFLNEKNGTYGVWNQFKSREKTATFDIVHPGDDYVLYGVTIDVDGNMSKPIDLLTKYTGQGTITTNPRSTEE